MTDRTTKGPKAERYNFERMKAAATSTDPAVRKAMFLEYFERFNEFPSFLFDNERAIDPMLDATVRELLADPETSKPIRLGLEQLLRRLPA